MTMNFGIRHGVKYLPITRICPNLSKLLVFSLFLLLLPFFFSSKQKNKTSYQSFDDETISFFERPYDTLREGNGTPLQYSCLENPMDGGAWWAAVHGVAKSQTRLSDFTFTLHFHALEKELATQSSVLAWRIPGTGSLVDCRLWGRKESDTTEAT